MSSGHDHGADDGARAAEFVFEGRTFPGEHEWLDLDLPADAPAAVRGLLSSGDPAPGSSEAGSSESVGLESGSPEAGNFVDRTLAALRGPTPEQLAAFATPEPSPDFVARAVDAVQQDRRARWREALARYIAPEPSAAFVERTLRALANDQERADGVAGTRTFSAPSTSSPRASALRVWALPLLAAAAVLAVAFLLPRDPGQTIELRAHSVVPTSLAPSWSSSPLPGVLIAIDAKADSGALPRSGADGIHLLLHGDR